MRCRSVRWPFMLLVLVLGLLAALLVWFIRSMLRVANSPSRSAPGLWDWDWLDVFFGALLFILVVFVGVISTCRGAQRLVFLTTASPSSPPRPVTVRTLDLEVRTAAPLATPAKGGALAKLVTASGGH